jgi:hypothetical protein
MSEVFNIVYVGLNKQNIAEGITESYSLPKGNNISLGNIKWEDVDMTILGKMWTGSEWIEVLDSASPSGNNDVFFEE